MTVHFGRNKEILPLTKSKYPYRRVVAAKSVVSIFCEETIFPDGDILPYTRENIYSAVSLWGNGIRKQRRQI